MTERAAFERLLASCGEAASLLRRMTGSAIDGEDVVQEAILKALEALDESSALPTRKLAVPYRAQTPPWTICGGAPARRLLVR